MVSSTLNPKTARVTATENLVLRVRGSSRDGQIVRLASPKCTIGSGEQCTLRLRSRNVGRMHCLIVRGPNGTVARRLAPDTRLNGAPFSDALLTAGDRLSVGGIDLDILATGEPPHRRKVEPAARTRDRDAELVTQLDDQRRQLDDDRRELDDQRQRLEAERQSFDARRAERQAERAAAEEQLHQASEQSLARAAELDARTTDLDARAAELDAKRRQLEDGHKEFDGQRQQLEAERQSFDAQRAQWQSERTATEQQLRQDSEQPLARAAELDARAVEVESRNSELQTRAAELESRSNEMAARAEELDRRAAESQAAEARLGEERTALENDRRQWESERTEREAELDGRARDLDARAADCESRSGETAARAEELDRRAAEVQAAEARLGEERSALENERRQWENERTGREAELEGRARDLDARAAMLESRPAEPAASFAPSQEEPAFEAPKEDAPVDLAAVFRKLGAKPALAEDEEGEPRPAKFPMRGKLGVEESSAARPATETAPAKPKHDEDEGSIDDYMAQLLQRMRSPAGQTAAPASRPAASPPCAPIGSGASDASETESSGPSVAELPPGRRKPAQMSPLAVAPEKHGGLAAMRELANMSAQTALHKHARGQTKKSARGKLLVAAVGTLVGGLLFVLWFHWEAGPLAFLAAMAGFTVGAIWGLHWAFLTGHLIVNKGRVQWAAKPAKKSEGPPAEERTSPAAADEPLAGAAGSAPRPSPDDETATRA